MKAYLFSLAAGLLVGVVYSLLGVRSPAPPMIALVGLLGILLGEQIIPLAGSMLAKNHLAEVVISECREHVLGRLPGHKDNA
ncbi:XapX domain-containing protein [Novosphingobium sp. 9]|uniref:XapX domain-containing protein n=1 Tax=Novosphingobium sp. 9 TaxID=2025349 RepID=UPI0021B585B2|nr:XapX domain-containing protein [Novosphingobium sp. 9]